MSEPKVIYITHPLKIVEYNSTFKTDFKKLNEEWIKTFFEMEESDYKSLDHPEENIINKGGKILMALLNNEVVGTCALIKMPVSEYDFELAKMAVHPDYRNLKIGSTLGKAIIELAASMGAKKLFLESNTILASAINLYYKLGFKKVVGYNSPYKRSNIQMELILPAR